MYDAIAVCALDCGLYDRVAGSTLTQHQITQEQGQLTMVREQGWRKALLQRICLQDGAVHGLGHPVRELRRAPDGALFRCGIVLRARSLGRKSEPACACADGSAVTCAAAGSGSSCVCHLQRPARRRIARGFSEVRIDNQVLARGSTEYSQRSVQTAHLH